jgi:hypothetical protein
VGPGGKGGSVSAYSFVLGMGGVGDSSALRLDIRQHGVLSVACSIDFISTEDLKVQPRSKLLILLSTSKKMQNEIIINTSFVTS